MLNWTQRSDGWYANGLRIELAAPFRWLLLDSGREIPAVGLGQEPLAVARSLTECKREAELLVAKRRRADRQRRHIMTLLLVVAGTPLLLGVPSNTNVVIFLIALVLATRSTIALLSSLMPSALGEQHEVFYQ
jgi:hypothetical protein